MTLDRVGSVIFTFAINSGRPPRTLLTLFAFSERSEVLLNSHNYLDDCMPSNNMIFFS